MVILYNHQPQLPPEPFIRIGLGILVAPSVVAVLLTFRYIHSLGNQA